MIKIPEIEDYQTHKGAYFVFSAIIGGIIAWFLFQKKSEMIWCTKLGKYVTAAEYTDAMCGETELKFRVQIIASNNPNGAYPKVIYDSLDSSKEEEVYFSIPATYPNVKLQAIVTKPDLTIENVNGVISQPTFAWYLYNGTTNGKEYNLENEWVKIDDNTIKSEISATYNKLDSTGVASGVRLIYSDAIGHNVESGWKTIHIVKHPGA